MFVRPSMTCKTRIHGNLGAMGITSILFPGHFIRHRFAPSTPARRGYTLRRAMRCVRRIACELRDETPCPCRRRRTAFDRSRSPNALQMSFNEFISVLFFWLKFSVSGSALQVSSYRLDDQNYKAFLLRHSFNKLDGLPMVRCLMIS